MGILRRPKKVIPVCLIEHDLYWEGYAVMMAGTVNEYKSWIGPRLTKRGAKRALRKALRRSQRHPYKIEWVK